MVELGRYPDTHVVVELELTPVWWRELTKKLTAKPREAPVRMLLVQAQCLALELPGVQSVVVEMRRFVVKLSVPRDASNELLCQAAGKCRDKIHALEITCLARD